MTMMKQYICSEKIPIDDVVDRLYDFSALGALSIPHVLTEAAQQELLEGILSAQPLFSKVQRELGEVIQEMETVYMQKVADKIPFFPLFEQRINQLQKEYLLIYQKIADKASFTEKTFNSVGVHHYPIGSAGITPHQDFSSDINLIASFVVAGNAPFFVCSNREKAHALELKASPGTLILMRAARTKEEQKKRPFHYLVGPITEERYSILIRTRTKINQEGKETRYY